MTEAGPILASIYHESDLLVAEALRARAVRRARPGARWPGWSPPSPSRPAGPGTTTRCPASRAVVERLARLDALAGELRADERRVGLRRTRRPDPGLARAVIAWATGATLDSVLRETDIAPGDFVRNVRQLIDLVRQLAQVAPGPGHPRGRRTGRGPPPAGGGRGRRPGRGWGPRLTRRSRRSVIRACSPTPWRRSPPTRRTSSAATSPTSTSRCSPWSTCPKWSKGPCSPGTRAHPKSLRRLFLDEFVGELDISGDATVDATVGLKRAEELYEKVFLEYGDDSVAQLGGVHLACEQASNVLTKVLEWGRLMAYLEQSTRYIAYNQRLTTGHYRYYRDPGLLDSPLGARYVGEMDRMFDTYGELLDEAQAWLAVRHPRQPGDSDFVHRQAVRAKALDALRGLLPAASLSNVGIYGTGQSYEMLLLRMRSHPLPEARQYADLMLERAAQGDPVVPPAGGPTGPGRGVVGVPGRGPGRRPASWSSDCSPTWSRPAEPRPAGPSGHPSVTLVDFDPDGEVEGHRRHLRPAHRPLGGGGAAAGRPARCRGEAVAAAGLRRGSQRTGATGRVGPSSAPATGSTWSPTTAPSATCSATAC